MIRTYVVSVHAETTSKKKERAAYKIRTIGPVEAKRIAVGEFFAYENAHQNRFMKLLSVAIKEVEEDDA